MGYALYDADSNLYEQGKVVLSKKARNKHEELIQKLAVKKDGYIETYLVNETPENVWFDQFRVLSTGPLIVQETHYDPWGVELSGLGYQYGGIKVNPYLYNGKEANGHLGVNLFDYGARMYDPAIGRWFVVDPMAEKAPDWTPYRYGFNNPMKYTDPTGMFEYVKGGYGEDIEVGNVWSHTEDGGYLSDGKNDKEGGGQPNGGGTQNCCGDDKKKTENKNDQPSANPNAVQQSGSREINNNSNSNQRLGSKLAISANITPISGYAVEFGVVWDRKGGWGVYLSYGESVGIDASVGIVAGDIQSNKREGFSVVDYNGYGTSHNLGISFFDLGFGGDRIGAAPHLNYGNSYYEMEGGGSIGTPLGYTKQFTYTKILWGN